MRLEISNATGIDLSMVDHSDQLIAMIQHLSGPTTQSFLYIIFFSLIGTYLITTVSSALFVLSNVSNSNRASRRSKSLILFWGLFLGVTSLLIDTFNASGAIQAMMCLFAIPVAAVVIMLSGSLLKAVFLETRPEFDRLSLLRVCGVHQGTHATQTQQTVKSVS